MVIPLAERARGFYFRRMKRISFLLALALIATPSFVHAQDAATEERLNKLTAQIQDLIEAQGAQSKRIEALAKEVQVIQQESQNKPVTDYAAQSDVKELAAKLREVDRKRQEDNERILDELKKLGRNLTTGSGKKPAAQPPKISDEGASGSPNVSGKVFEYKIQNGDTLGAIVKAYAEKNIKVTIKQILDANPGLKPEKMYVGQKIFIPAPQ